MATVSRQRRLDIVAVPAGAAANETSRPVQTSAPGEAKPSTGNRYVEAFPLKGIVGSKTNPRKTFDAVKLRELADSIRDKGVLEPLLCRPSGLGGDVIELVAGERRFRAAHLAHVTHVPVRILDLDDQAALEVQVVENLQRDDLDPLEEAEGFDQLLKAGRYGALLLAQKVNKSEAYIYGALKLLDLPANAREALRDGTINRSIGQLIGRIPSEKLREEAAEEILEQVRLGQIANFKDAKEFVESEYMVELKGAPFDQADASLTPAGPCSTCPARAGNSRHLFPDCRADICTDTACYREKVRAHAERRESEARESGHAVIENGAGLFSPYFMGGAAKRHDLKYGSAWIDLDAKCHDDPANRTYRQILGDDASELTSVAVDPAGVAHDIVARKMAEPILKREGVLTSSGRSQTHAAEDAKRAAEQKIKAEVSRRIQAEVARASEIAFSSWLGAGPPPMRPLAVLLFDCFWHDIKVKVQSRRKFDSWSKLSLDPRQCLELLAELAATKALQMEIPAGDDLLKALKIDRKAIERQVRKDAKAKAEKKGKAGK